MAREPFHVAQPAAESFREKVVKEFTGHFGGIPIKMKSKNEEARCPNEGRPCFCDGTCKREAPVPVPEVRASYRMQNPQVQSIPREEALKRGVQIVQVFEHKARMFIGTTNAVYQIMEDNSLVCVIDNESFDKADAEYKARRKS